MTACGRRDSGTARRQDCTTISPHPYPLPPKPPPTPSKDDFQLLHEAICTLAISVGLDRTSVPFEEARPKDVDRDACRKKRSKPYVRGAPSAVEV